MQGRALPLPAQGQGSRGQRPLAPPAEGKKRGVTEMKCPFCSYTDSKVVDSRPTDEGSSIRRRRECLNCLKRFTTYETVERMPLMLVKRDGTRQPYDRQKLLSGVVKACEKRPVPLQRLEGLVDAVERKLYSSLDYEVSSKAIGEMVMEELRSVDEVAYVRFASVYRQFKDINTFMEELNLLIKDK